MLKVLSLIYGFSKKKGFKEVPCLNLKGGITELSRPGFSIKT